MTIHASDPFATPDDLRSPLRKLRGRLPAAVTLWTSGGDAERAGLTVSSTLVVEGEPGRVLGLLDDESELWALASATGRFAVTPLGPADRQLADRFAGLMPAPGGLFREYTWKNSDWGPIPDGHPVWVGCRVDTSRQIGWSLLVEATIEQVTVEAESAPLIHYRGRYHEL